MEKQAFVDKEEAIVDASYVEVPRHRNTPEENKMIKEGQTRPG